MQRYLCSIYIFLYDISNFKKERKNPNDLEVKVDHYKSKPTFSSGTF